ncbi:hypothetical protein SERLADRAFT_433909 [Serpula lacrymans var. lacrymans S7.9]|uniref:Retrovirus-related Pol polyprotein from transposon TNT 1-94-like beta-barrel domain-containing protein n=1 Tax=Serpula lacrymans var. lacrymans (strain S7.9) TaxID=578457 RepID=F8NIQ5_SERL9|nr:uncharacterized protein SERLADRAFT_433909 [Serpula lacrymans var. lacrymans S7.9]EGO29970.1 hypothetical protein SERLADRAFT_433909 [Serpula lacrymans var. lacrymans S7.9]
MAEKSSGSDSEEEQSYITLEHVHISKPLAKHIQAYLVSKPNKTKTTIIIDSGATIHMVSHHSCFGDESSVNAIGIGTVILQATVGKKDYNIALSNVLLVPNFTLAFISVHKLSKMELLTLFL